MICNDKVNDRSNFELTKHNFGELSGEKMDQLLQAMEPLLWGFKNSQKVPHISPSG